MAIKIIKTEDVYVTASELKAYRYRFQKEFSGYCGPLPDFEEWVADQEKTKKAAKNG